MISRMSEKVRENKARDRLKRRGFKLSKSRLRDPKAIGYGEYTITNASRKAPRTRVILESLEAVEAWLELGQ